MLLVTTALQDTWDEKKKIYFLGEWCIRDSENFDLKKKNYQILSYHWDDREKYKRDYLYLQDLYEEYLHNISQSLNKIHNINKPVKYWRIIIGPWLKYFIDTIFDRYETIKKIDSHVEIQETINYTYKVEDLVAYDFMDFYNEFRNDAWNHLVFAEILKKFSIKFIPNNKKVLKKNIKKISAVDWIKKKINNTLFIISSFFNNTFFLSTYLPTFKSILLNIKFGLFPHLNFYYFDLKKKKIDINLRKKIQFKKNSNDFQNILNSLVRVCFPIIYLEDFKYVRNNILNKFKKAPKIIFTANAYQGDDFFKIWCAENKEKGTNIIIGQHGGVFGLCLNSHSEDHQLKISDIYCSWGWKKKAFINISKMPSLQLSGINILPKLDGGILLVLPSYPRYFYTNNSLPIAGQSKIFFHDQIKFIKNLNINLRESIFIRTQGNDVDELSIISKAKLNKFVVSNKIKLIKQLSKYRLCLITYNSTTMLETLSSNFPSLIVLDPKYFEIREEAKDILNKLQEVGILHYSYDSAISFIVKVEKDINKWWLDYKLQSAVKKFCNSYAYTSSNFEIEWKKKIKSWTNEIKI